jgi:hypothetical protein
MNMQCQVCGSMPAQKFAAYRCEGLIFMMRWRTTRAVLCRTHALALIKEELFHTLLWGWWSFISFFATLIGFLPADLLALQKARKLEAPRPATPPGYAVAPSYGAAPNVPHPSTAQGMYGPAAQYAPPAEYGPAAQYAPPMQPAPLMPPPGPDAR